jgi:hypothetical protein
MASPNKKRSVLSNGDRLKLYYQLAAVAQNGKVPHGEYSIIAARFSVHCSTATRIWQRGRDSLLKDSAGALDVRRRNFLAGRKPTYTDEVLNAKLRSLPLKLRKSAKDAAHHLGISPTQFLRNVNDKKLFRAATVSVKPLLTERHRSDRVDFVRTRITPSNHTNNQNSQAPNSKEFFDL